MTMFSVPSFFRPTIFATTACILLLAGRSVRADGFDDMRKAWFDDVTGGNKYQINDPVIKEATKQVDADAARAWESLKTAKPFKDSCFSDVTFGKSSAVTAAYNRLSTMARAYQTRGGAYYGNAEMRADIIAACDWMAANQYNENTKESGNWWDWEIGTPLALNTVTTAMYDYLTPEQVVTYMKPVGMFTTKYTGGKGGANGAWVAIISAVRAVLIKDAAKLQFASDEFSRLAIDVNSGDGFYDDGSYIGHNYFAYNGGYGLYFLQSIADGYFLMGPNSAYPLPIAKRAVVYGWVKNSYWPLMYRGQMPYFTLGREIGRGPSGNRSNAVAFSIIQLVGADRSPDAKLLLRMAKRIFIDGGQRYGSKLGEVVKFKALMADKSIAPLSAANQSTIFSTEAKAVALRPNWGLGLSYYSPRVFNYEDAGENRRGWHQADGMVYLNNADSDQFNGDFWPTVDSTRLPGTTETKAVTGGSNRPNGDVFAGGANLNQYFAAVGFTFKPGNEQALTANKAWFTFDDEVVCLGSGITSTGGKEVETVIENRKLKDDGSNALTIDGKAQPTTRPWNIKAKGAHWMHLAGSVSGSDIGYYFPNPIDVDLIREQRSDSWRSIHVQGSERSVTESFLTVTTSHGTDPTGAYYAYVLLPNRDATAVAKYAVKPGVTVLANTAGVSAVRENSLGVLEALFWEDQPTNLDLLKGKSLSSDKKAAVVIRETKKQVEVAVSDPTRVNEGTIDLEFSRAIKSVVSADANITVVQKTPTLKLRVDVKGAKGKTFQAQFLAVK